MTGIHRSKKDPEIQKASKQSVTRRCKINFLRKELHE